MKTIFYSTIAAIVISMMTPTIVSAQEPRLYGDRLLSKDGKWLLPIASLHLTSTEKDHIGRGSVQAWDISGPKNQPVYPIADGIVEFAGCELSASHGYGCYIVIFYPEFNKRSIFAHCGVNTVKVKRNQKVDAWTVVCGIDFVGKTSFGPHVHFELHEAVAMDKYTGKRHDIGQFWDINAMKYERLADTHVHEVITQIGIVTPTGERLAVNGNKPKSQNVATVADATKSLPMLSVAAIKLAALPDTALGLIVICYVVLVVFCGKTVRSVVLSGTVCFVLIGVFTQSPTQVLAENQTPKPETKQAVMSDDEVFKFAYKLLDQPGFEGRRCTEDGAHTMAGITQGALNRYLKRHGLPQGDVCQILTEEIKVAITYEDYWLASKADQLAKIDPKLAISHFDFSFNSGAGDGTPGMAILQKCGNDWRCYQEQRATWYRGRSQFGIYGNGWLNRVAKLTKILEAMP